VLKGRNVALTGTVSSTGEVGHISGIKQKTVLAIRNNVSIMFVPRDNKVLSNYSDAKGVLEDLGSDMELVVVDNLSDIIDYLSK
jgi:PDZ domain-containing protein